jgi:hypothetical protein
VWVLPNKVSQSLPACLDPVDTQAATLLKAHAAACKQHRFQSVLKGQLRVPCCCSCVCGCS